MRWSMCDEVVNALPQLLQTPCLGFLALQPSTQGPPPANAATSGAASPGLVVTQTNRAAPKGAHRWVRGMWGCWGSGWRWRLAVGVREGGRHLGRFDSCTPATHAQHPGENLTVAPRKSTTEK